MFLGRGPGYETGMPEKLTPDEYDALATAPAETLEPREEGAWKDAPEGAIETEDSPESSDPSK